MDAHFGKMRRFIPVWSEKQLVQLQGGTGSMRTASISIEDVMFHAKRLAGGLGVLIYLCLVLPIYYRVV